MQLKISGLPKDTMIKGARGLRIQINYMMYMCMRAHE